MKTMFLAAAAGLLMLGGAAEAEPFRGRPCRQRPARSGRFSQKQPAISGLEPAPDFQPDGSSIIRNAARRANDQWASAGPRLGGLRRLGREAAASMGR
jgi:hypothetical protein